MYFVIVNHGRNKKKKKFKIFEGARVKSAGKLKYVFESRLFVKLNRVCKVHVGGFNSVTGEGVSLSQTSCIEEKEFL